MKTDQYVDVRFRKNFFAQSKISKNKQSIFTTYLFPILLILITGAISALSVYINNKAIKDLENTMGYKQQQHAVFINSSKHIIGTMSELNSHIQFELEKEILENLTSWKFLQNKNIGLTSLDIFKKKYIFVLQSIDEESIFLPKDLYDETKHSINALSNILTSNLILIFNEDFFDGFEIQFDDAKNPIQLNDKTKMNIHEIVNNFHREYEQTFEHLRSTFRDKINKE